MTSLKVVIQSENQNLYAQELYNKYCTFCDENNLTKSVKSFFNNYEITLDSSEEINKNVKWLSDYHTWKNMLSKRVRVFVIQDSSTLEIGCKPPIPDDIKTVDELYPYYLREHSKPATRYIHLISTISAISFAIFSFNKGFNRNNILKGIVGGLAVGYIPAWLSHNFIEKNVPLTGKYVLLSALCDFKMIKDIFTGNINREMKKALN